MVGSSRGTWGDAGRKVILAGLSRDVSSSWSREGTSTCPLLSGEKVRSERPCCTCCFPTALNSGSSCGKAAYQGGSSASHVLVQEQPLPLHAQPHFPAGSSHHGNRGVGSLTALFWAAWLPVLSKHLWVQGNLWCRAGRCHLPVLRPFPQSLWVPWKEDGGQPRPCRCRKLA